MGNQTVAPSVAGVTMPTNSSVYMSKVGQVPNQNGQQPSPTTIPEPNDKESNPQLKTTRRIVLAPNSNPEVNQVFDLLDGQGKTAPYSLAADPSPIDGNTATTDVQPAVAIVIDTMLNGPGAGGGPHAAVLAISDPPTTQGYFANGEQAVALVGSAEGELKFSTIEEHGRRYADRYRRRCKKTMMSNQTTLGYRTVHLQRLADPTLPYNPPPTDPYAGPVNNPKLPVNVYLTVDRRVDRRDLVQRRLARVRFRGAGPRHAGRDVLLGAARRSGQRWRSVDQFNML